MFLSRKGRVVLSILLTLVMLALISGCGGGTSTSKEPAKKEEAKKTFTPDKPVTMVVPFAAGGSTDMLARAVEKVWSKYCPQPLQVVNQPGGGGITGATAVSRAKPDGYTLVMGVGSGHDLVMPHIQKVEYDVFRDLTPISRMSVHTVAVLVPQNSPFNTIKDVIEWAKKENKPVTAAVSTKAGSGDIVVRGLGKAANINITPIPHAGGAQAMTSLIGEQTLIGGNHPSECISQLKANRLKAIGMATKERDSSMPDVPTLIEQGINFYTWGSIKGVAGPKDTPKEIVDYYAEVLKKVSEDAEYKKIMTDMYQPVMYLNPADTAKNLKEAYDEYGALVKQLELDK